MTTRHWKFLLTILAIIGLTLPSYASRKGPTRVKSPIPDKAPRAAIVKIMGTSEGSNIHGMLVFWEMDDGVLVKGHLSGVPRGDHGIHIHANGSCADGGKAAGGHYDPYGASRHGFLPEDGYVKAHLGDMGNITIADNGQGFLKVMLPGVSLDGNTGVSGHAVILHAKADDFGQPTGNAGGRIGCGVISSSAASDEVKGSMMRMKGSTASPQKKMRKESGYKGSR